MFSLKLSLQKLLQLPFTYLTKRSRPKDSQQVLQFVDQYFCYWHMHINRFSKLAEDSQIPMSDPTKDEETNFLAMDSGHAINNDSSTLSKRAKKRLARFQKFREHQKQKKAEQKKMEPKDDAGYSLEDLHQSTYYFENGLRKVYPYTFTFATHAKGRWVGQTIKNVLEKEFSFDKQEDLMKAFNAGKIHVNNQQVGPDYTIRDCDHISHRLHRHENPVTSAPIEIIKDTEDLVVINKPTSIPCHPCGRYRFNSVVFILGKEMGLTNLRNIYRLDRLTSGVLMLAKTTEMTKILEDQVAKRQVKKEYVCRVAGKFPDDLVIVEQPLRALSNRLRLQIVCPTGKASRTEFELISYNGKSSVVRCRPLTGRTHQIRVHLQYLGHPIINDAFYNNTAWGPGNGKGGNYEVPFEDVSFPRSVCAKILKDHHANLWDGGENPLYFEKVKEMEKGNFVIEKTMAGMSCDQIASSVLVSDKSTSNLNSALEGNENDTIHCLGQNSDIEPPNKKLKGDNIYDQMESYNPLTEKTIPQTFSKNRQSEEISQLENNVTDISNSNKDAAITRLTGGSDSHKCPSEEASGGNSQSQGQTLSNLCLNSRPGFEMSLWSVDINCDLCKRLTVEPRERDMVMFLHALKYKGPDWEYETNLPDWAKADWSLEEDYVDLKSVNCR